MLVKCMLVYMSYVSLYLYTPVIVIDFVHAYVAVFVQIVNVWCKSLCLYVCLLSFDGVYVYVTACLQVVCMQGYAATCVSMCGSVHLFKYYVC